MRKTDIKDLKFRVALMLMLTYTSVGCFLYLVSTIR